jgi:hypothetical protein
MLVAWAADQHDGALVPVETRAARRVEPGSALRGFLVHRLGYRRRGLFPNG